jgi:hypothetical protein
MVVDQARYTLVVDALDEVAGEQTVGMAFTLSRRRSQRPSARPLLLGEPTRRGWGWSGRLAARRPPAHCCRDRSLAVVIPPRPIRFEVLRRSSLTRPQPSSCRRAARLNHRPSPCLAWPTYSRASREPHPAALARAWKPGHPREIVFATRPRVAPGPSKDASPLQRRAGARAAYVPHDEQQPLIMPDNHVPCEQGFRVSQPRDQRLESPCQGGGRGFESRRPLQADAGVRRSTGFGG